MIPRAIRLHPDDDVAVIVNTGGLPAGAALPDGPTLIERIPQGHKVALHPIPKGAQVRRYGVVIGHAAEDLPAGSWVSEVRLVMPAARSLEGLPDPAPPPPPAPLDGFTFQGYRNADGTVGTRNWLGITTTVQCVAGVLDVALREIRRDLLPRYPQVDGVVGLDHAYGCGVAIDAPDAIIPIRTVRNLALHPNFGGEIMVVSLGCEKLQPERLLPPGSIPIAATTDAPAAPAPTSTPMPTPAAAAASMPGTPVPATADTVPTIAAAAHTTPTLAAAPAADTAPVATADRGVAASTADPGAPVDAPTGQPAIIRLQDEEHIGFRAMIDHIVAQADIHLQRLNRRRRETVPASALVVGVQCGGSDAFSGITANPAVGHATDLLIRAGATVMFSENTEVRDAVDQLTRRAATPDVAAAIVRELGWYDAYLARGQADRSANTTPGNKKGGLSNIVEKAMGSIVKSGTGAIHAVLAPGERWADHPAAHRSPLTGRLVFAATPASDFICGTLQLAAGMNLHIFTTGRGTPYGIAGCPVIKVSTREDLTRRWHDLMDIDAGRIATGSATVETVGWELFQRMLAVASGEPTWAERWGLHNDLVLFNPAPVT